MIKNIILTTLLLNLCVFITAQDMHSADSTLIVNNDENLSDSLVNAKDTVVVEVVEKEIIPAAPEILKYDTIFQKNGFAIVGNIKDKNLYEVNYVKKGEKLVRKISTRNLKAIHYATGKIEIIDNNPEKQNRDWVPQVAEIEWKKVKIVYEENAVAGMIELGEVAADYEAKKIRMGNDVLERNAIIIMQKKAYLMDAKAILILSKDIRREYGEIPTISMKAMAYGAAQ